MPYTLQDASGQYSPGEWARAVELYHELKADFIVAEANKGGEMVAHVVADGKLANLKCSVNERIVHASRGKQTRAEPVAALYEQKRARHVGAFPDLEDQMTTWVARAEVARPDGRAGVVGDRVWRLRAHQRCRTPDGQSAPTSTRNFHESECCDAESS